MLLHWSCATHEPLIDAKNDSDVNSTQFDIIPAMNYIVDGKVTADKDLIKTVQKNAWNVHFNFPESKVVISTTEREFDEYVNSDEAFKTRLEENDRDAVNHEKEINIISNSTASSARISATPTLRVDYSNTVFFNVAYRPLDKSRTEHNSLAATSSQNTKAATTTNSTTSSGTATKTTFKLTNTQENSFFTVSIRNSKESGTVTKTFYRDINYGGTSKTYSLGANSSATLPSSLVYYSYK